MRILLRLQRGGRIAHEERKGGLWVMERGLSGGLPRLTNHSAMASLGFVAYVSY